MDKAIAENFFDPAYYDRLWRARYFCPFDVNHYLYEVVKDKKDSLRVDAYDLDNKKIRSYDIEQFVAMFNGFWLYNAVIMRISWRV